MKYWYDTEFYEAGNAQPIRPISIGIVAEDERELYLEILLNWDHCPSEWLHQNVKPYLQTVRKRLWGNDLCEVSASVIGGMYVDSRGAARAVREFVGEDKPEWWGYYSSYDHVVLCQFFGTMIDLPKGWPMYTRDIKQWCDMLGNPQLPKQESTEHSALCDARWNKEAWEFLRDYDEQRRARSALIHAGEWTEPQ